MRNQRIVIVLTCDHCPAGESQEVADTVKVGYGSGQYELDLCQTHNDNLAKTMAGIISGARRTGRASKSGGTKAEKQFRDDARAWAQKTGHHVNRVGVIPAETMDAYREYLRGQVT